VNPSAAKLQSKKRTKSKEVPQEEPSPNTFAALVRIPKAAEIVAGHIRKMILRKELAEGGYLAPESQLLKHFGISRPTLREALRILETEQFISVSRGSRTGALVQLPRGETVARYAGFALQAQGATLSDVYAARMAIEPYAARLLAQASDPKVIKRLKAEMPNLYAQIDAEYSPQFNVAIARMHRLMVSLTGNRTLTLLMDMIEEVLERHQSRFVASEFGTNDPGRIKIIRLGLRSFDKLIELIEAKDPAKAEAHWRAHIENANATWLEGVDRTAILDILD
jgi:DNA-binding FadR family transcriptional regulator